MNIYDIGIIGGGVAGAFAALSISEKKSSEKVIVFDFGRPPGKRRRQLEGWLGCFPASDGKLYLSDIEKVKKLSDKSIKISEDVIGILSNITPMKLIKDNIPNSVTLDKINKAEFDIQTNSYYQWKPESVHKLSKFISNIISNNKNIDFSFDNEVYEIIKSDNQFLVKTATGNFICKKIIFAAGRSGWRWAEKIYQGLGIKINNDYANFGIKVEMPSQYLKDFNKSHCILTKDNLSIGPFSWFGSMIPEDHADLVISNFRSNEDRWITDKVYFSILSSQYYKNEGCYQTDRIAKLAFLLFNDRVSKEKIKLFMDNKSLLSLLPEFSWLKKTLTEVNKIIPEILSVGNMYIPDILALPPSIKLNSCLESEVDNFYVIGESAAIKGILSAAIMGMLVGKNI